ncbi:MAG TPA: hypothetical protein VK563_21660 [Puia sp.]|nr:hypothetical protein [Puia sp.]
MLSDKRRNVFISGSAYEYGKFGESGKHFIKDLSKGLLKNDFMITSGYGIGVGQYIVEAVLEDLLVDDRENIAEKLQVFPFPPGDHHSEELKHCYRNNIMARTGTALFIFGNKLEDISVKESNGMLKEFEIACANNALVIPVGASGYISQKLWEMVFEKYDDYFETREKYILFEQLGDPSTDGETLIDLVIRIAN